ncbi:hypothetical protein ACH427_31570 [Streptomyces sp. NPDC020379]|uniref:hypothetical protein n=1 Tax=Streptomyces sp. NPDC020379 TaxID=3365071 RepID=UPI00378B8BE5
MREQYRVAVWGTGPLGGALVRHIATMDSLKLVGAFSYTPAKSGRDVGEVIGIGTMGAQVTTDREALIAQHPDVVLHAPRIDGNWDTDDDVLELLGAGINVITALPYHGLRWRGDGAYNRFQRKAAAGGATLYVTGADPDFVERLVLTLTGLCGQVSHILVREIWAADGLGPLLFQAAGFGQPLSAVQSASVLKLADDFVTPTMRLMGEHIGAPLGRVEATDTSMAAPEDINLGFTTIKRGTLGTLRLRWDGYVADRVACTFEMLYYCGETMRPPEAVAAECWIIEIEGRPSVRVTLDMVASIRHGTTRYDHDPTTPGYYASAAPLLQAIPLVVDAPAGIKECVMPTLHYTHDLRQPRP